MRGFIVGTIVTAIAFFVLTKFLPQFVSYDGQLLGLLVLAVIFGLVNGLIGPIVRTLAFPLTFMTMGLIGFVINAGLLLVTAAFADAVGLDLKVGHFPPTLLSADTLVSAVIGAVVLSVVSTVVHFVVLTERDVTPTGEAGVPTGPAIADALRRAADQHGTPAYVTDLATLDRAAAALRDAFPYPWIRQYSLKANDVPEIVAEVTSRGFGANVVSRGEWAVA